MKTREIADLVGGVLHGDGDVEIGSAAGLNAAQSGQITFFERVADLPQSAASCIIVSENMAADGINTCLIAVANPKLAFARIAAKLHDSKRRSPGIHQSAVISASAVIGAEVFIGASASAGEASVIGSGSVLMAGVRLADNVSVGSDCVLHPNVVIEDGCTIGNGVILHAGVVIGADGFGYVKDESGSYVKFPQIGTVVIEDDVEIGANSCVDRGALGITRIGSGTKIDNLVQVGHNVDIGKRCVIAAQTGISGSVVIEDDCVIGGQVGFGDHAHVQSGAVVGSQAGVLPGKIVRPGVWWGTPIQPLAEFKRQHARVKGLERLNDDVKELKRRSNESEASKKSLPENDTKNSTA